MQHMKRVLVWVMMGMLVLSLIPPGLARQASAAAATYFIPDINEFSATSKLILTDPADPEFLSRTKVYITNNPTFTVKGSFNNVTKETMKVKVEQLNRTGNGWDADNLHTTVGTLLADSNSTTRFTVNNLSLFPGFNKITFFGLQGGVERSDTFYILFDKIPFLQSLKVSGGGIQTTLAEGAPVVVESGSITLQGIAKNVTGVTVAANKGSAVLGNVMDDGGFFTPAVALQTGLNDLELIIKNGSDSVTINRQVYYFDKSKPFTSLVFTHLDEPQDYEMLNKNVIVSSGSSNSGNTFELTITMLLKYVEGVPFDDNSATYNMNDDPSGPFAVDPTTVTETIIPGSDGVTPEYRKVTFKTNPFPFKQDSNSDDLKQQTFKLQIGYNNTVITPYFGKFTFLPGEKVIKEMYYMPNYDGTSASFDSFTKLPIDNVEVAKKDFYVMVKTDKPLDSTDVLGGEYLPLGTTPLTFSGVAVDGSTGTENLYAFEVSDFLNGQQKVRFHITGSTAPYVANISFSSKDYIYLDNLFDGQQFSFDSRSTHTVKINGEYLGFEGLLSPAQYSVNGQAPIDLNLTPPDDMTFTADLVVGDGSAAEPLVFGENRIVFTGKTVISGITRNIRKDIRFYIIDTNVSQVFKFIPTVAPATDDEREPFPDQNIVDSAIYTDAVLNRIMPVSPEFLLTNGQYKTGRLMHDLVLKGSGATTINLREGSQLILSKDIDLAGSLDSNVDYSYTLPDLSTKTTVYDFAGDQDNFILRVQDLDLSTPGAHVYTLELINATGARTTQRLEIVREVSAFRILSPQATVGNEIIVNKNFVRFDIEAEGAIDVLINGQKSVKRSDLSNRFVYDFVGLKPDKLTAVKLQIVRSQGSLNSVVNVYYTSAVQTDTQYMQLLSNKISVFGKSVELTFPKGTVLKSANPNSQGVTKFYKDNQLLFGIADPKDGVIERRNDYGNIIGQSADGRSTGGTTTIAIPVENVQRFNATDITGKFSRISQVYWINGGWGEEGDKTSPTYKPALNGQAPYFIEGNTVRSFADTSDPIPEERKVIPSNRGTLKLSFNSNVVDEMAYTITAFRYSDLGVWENIGGQVDIKNHTITVPFDEFGYYMVGKMKSGYNDITTHPWARNILNGLYSKGIMSNLRFDEFGADDQTSRGEFATLLVKSLNFKLDYDVDNPTFSDVVVGAKTPTWDFEHIETAARAGIVSGFTEGSFAPDLKVTREEAAVMISRALKLKLATNDDKLEAALSKAFVDSASVQVYARPAVQAVTKAGVMSGTAVTVTGQKKPMFNFNPKANLTRAEAGSITVKLLQKFTKIFPKNFS